MAIAGRCRVPLLLSLQLTLLLTAATVSGLPEWHYQRHVDMYRARYHQRTTTASWSDTDGFRGISRHDLPQRSIAPPHLSGGPAQASGGQNHLYRAPLESQRWEPPENRAGWRRQRPHPPHQRHYHERSPAHYIRDQQVSSSRRADTEPVWLEDTVPSQDSEPARQYLQRPHSAAESAGAQHSRLLNGEISVEIGQSSRNFSVRDGVVIGAEHVKLWRIGGSDTAELSDKGGRLWSNNGTALFRRDDFSDGRVISNEIGDFSSQDKEKEPKFFFPLFTIIRFPNEPCSSDQQDGFTASGTCFLPSECAGNGGLARGSCALGFGVCCVFTLSCGGTTDKNGTFFVNPEYPSTGTTARTCSFSVNKISPDVSQIRLDFEEFTVSAKAA
ncbi:hypothetical protein FJT64_026558 [Amphibalanus amphitrite]|uniref:CUB domain-containing protein n=1 Tax=Amphibalanus amphitrite TaxID=1232801 RepID=A0A6A4WGA7_AMPAM|nr:hypothetical protein FJT64_026558 [Amphibalanus amphitrite]